MWQIIELSATFVQGIICFWFLDGLLESKCGRYRINIRILTMAVIYMLAGCWFDMILNKDSTIVLSIIVFLYVFLNFENAIWDKISSFIAIEMIIGFVAQFLVHTFSFLFHVKPVELTKQENIERLLILFVGQILCWAIAKMVLCMARQWGNVWKDKKVLGVLVFSIAVIWGLRQIVYLGEVIPEYRHIIGIFVAVLSVNIVVLYVARKFYLHEEELRRYGILMANAEEVYRINEESRKLRHDMKNILLVSIGYLEDGKLDKALQYLRMIQDEELQMGQPIVCENDELSYLLTVKRQKCREEDISFHYIISTNLSEISGMDLSIILGNLLDNAIEGVGKIRERKIDVQIQERNGYYRITVQNSIDQTVLGNNRHLSTTKENAYEHGWGVKSVKAVVKKYHGICEFSEADGMFIAEVLLPIE